MKLYSLFVVAYLFYCSLINVEETSDSNFGDYRFDFLIGFDISNIRTANKNLGKAIYGK